MSGKLIALESNDSGQLLRAAEDLANQLRGEGYKVEIKAFPQRAHSAAYFVNRYEQGAYGQSNPYVTSLFYALDRFESKQELEALLANGVHVVCAGYLGTTLATLGAAFTDKQVRKGYYTWAYSLETGTFGTIKPDTSIVISEHVATFSELCELFPKDYILETNVKRIRHIIQPIVPELHTDKTPPSKNNNLAANVTQNTTSLRSVLDELTYQGNPKISIHPGQHVKHTITAEPQAREFHKALTMLAEKRKGIVQSVAKKDRASLEFLLLPLASKVTLESPHKRPKPKPTVLQQLIDEYVPLNYGESSGSMVVDFFSSQTNELGILSGILAETSGISQVEAARIHQTLSYEQKSTLLEAYVADVASGQQFGAALLGVTYSCRVRLNAAELLELKRLAPQITLNVTQITPRFGYRLPPNLQQYEATVESYFDTALEYYMKLSNTTAAELLVLAGNTLDTFLLFDAKTAVQFADIHDSDVFKTIKKQLVELHPILFSALFT